MTTQPQIDNADRSQKCEAVCTSRYWKGRKCNNYASQKAGDKWVCWKHKDDKGKSA